MTRHFAWVLAAILLCTPGLAHGRGPQQPQRGDDRQARDQRPSDPPRWKWWLNAESRKELDVTDAQSVEIDRIFEASIPPQRAKLREAEALEEELTRTLKASVADVATVTQQVERLEKLNAERRTLRAVMIYRMNLVLTAEQRVKLEAFMKRRAENQRKASDHRDI